MAKFVRFSLFQFRSRKIISRLQTILFTTDDTILEKISTFDELYVDQENVQEDEETNRTNPTSKTSTENDVNLQKINIDHLHSLRLIQIRPMTCALQRRPFTASRSSTNNSAQEFYGKS